MKNEVNRKKGRRNGKPITEKWRPVYVWLESLNQREVVKAVEIGEWLEAHPDVRQRLRMSHTNEHIFNYIQKCHTRMIVDPRARSHNVKLDVIFRFAYPPVFTGKVSSTLSILCLVERKLSIGLVNGCTI